MLSTYSGKKIYHGEMHEHSASGGTSDGKMTLAEWNAFREKNGLDFIAILDHRQVRHMYLPEYDASHSIYGTEPGTYITDADAEERSMHYNMLFPRREDLEELLSAFPEYEFTGGIEGHFVYPKFTRERFAELIKAVRARGGMFVHPHPKQLMRAEDCEQYAISDKIGLETIYISYDSQETRDNYLLWKELLCRGRIVWACAGTDSHGKGPDTKALTSVYSEGSGSAAWLKELSRGNFACGPVGIQAEIDSCPMGSEVRYKKGDIMLIRLGDTYQPETGKTLILNVIEGHDGIEETILSETYDSSDTVEKEIKIGLSDYCRLELLYGESIYGIGNPIWNIRQ